MRDLDGAHEHIAIGERELEMQMFAHRERFIGPQPEALFRYIDDAADKRVCTAPDVTGSINGNAIELSLVWHALHVPCHSCRVSSGSSSIAVD